MAQAVEILIKAKNEADAAFKAVINQLQTTGKEAQKTNDILGKIASDLKGKLGGAAESAAGNLGGMASSLQALGPAGSAAAVGLGAVVAVVGAAIKISVDAAMAAANYADKLAGLADKSGLSTKSLQALDVAAQLGNSSMEAVAGAVNKMQLALAKGSDGFRQMGLNIAELRKLSPEDQFAEVSRAILAIEDPVDRAAVGTKVLGKSWSDLIGTMKAAADGAGDLGGALSDEAAAAAADLKDNTDLLTEAWTRVQRQFGAAIAQSPELRKGILDLANAVASMATKIAEAAPHIAKFFDNFANGVRTATSVAKAGGGFFADLFGGKGVVVASATAAGRISGDAYMQALRQEIARMKNDIGIGEKGKGVLAGPPIKIGPSDEEIAKAKAAREKLVAEEKKLREDLWKHAKKGYEDQVSAEKKLRESEWAEKKRLYAEEVKEAKEADEERSKSYEQMSSAMLDAIERRRNAELDAQEDFANLIGQIADLFQDFGLSADNAFVSVLRGFESGLHAATAFADATNKAQKAMAALSALQGAFNSGSAGGGAAAGATFGAQFGILGAGIGAAVGALAGLFGGAKKAREEMNKLRNEFVQSAGGMAALKAQAQAAGVSLDGMFKQKSASALAAQIDTIKAKLQDWDEAQKILKEGMDRYGISVSDMGARFAALELDKQAREMAMFFAAAIQVGANASAVTAGMKDEVLALVAQYQAAGMAIPAALRPVLEAMLKNGDLVKENGEAYGSLEEAGLTFAETMEGALSNLTAELAKLRETLARGFHIPVTYDVSEGSAGSGSAGGTGGNRPPRDEGVPEFGSPAFIPHQPGGLLNRIAEREDEFAIPRSMLQQMFNAAAAANGGSNQSIKISVVQNNREVGQTQAFLSRTRQQRTSPNANRRF